MSRLCVIGIVLVLCGLSTCDTNVTTTNNTTRKILHIALEGTPVVILELYEKAIVNMNYSLGCDHPSTVYRLNGKCLDEDVAYVVGDKSIDVACDSGGYSYKGMKNKTTVYGAPFQVHGRFNLSFNSHLIGRTLFNIRATKIDGPGSQNWTKGMKHQMMDKHAWTNKTLNNTLVMATHVLVMPPNQELEKIVRPIMIAVGVLVSLSLGVKVQLDIVKTVLKKPVAPIVGLFCQFICMPLIAFMVAKVISQPSAALRLSTFACGVAPGGGQSNLISNLIGGDISLSITMTTISSIAAFGMIPAWMMTLGQQFSDSKTSLKIPFVEILKALSMFIVPNIAGILLKWKYPKVAMKLAKFLLPPSILVSLGLLGLMIYKSIYVFEMLTAQQILAGCLMPYCGYFIGGLIAFLTRRSWTHIKTIAIETGIQNTAVTSTMLYLSVPPPDNVITILVPIASSLMTPLPLWLFILGRVIYRKVKGIDGPDSDDESGDINKNSDDDANHDKEKDDTGNKDKGKYLEDKKAASNVEIGSNENRTNVDEEVSLWDKLMGKLFKRTDSKSATVDEDDLDLDDISRNDIYKSQTSVDGLIHTKM